MRPDEAVARRMSPPVSDARRRLMATCQMARKALGLDEDSYRAVVARVAGQPSLRVCSDAQLQLVVGEFKRLGFKPAPGKGAKPASSRGKVRAIFAVWGDIRPHLEDATDEALFGFVRRQTRSKAKPDGVARPEWLTDHEANAVLDGLKGWRGKLTGGVHGD